VAEHAILRASYELDREPHHDNKGQITCRTRNERLVVRNSGPVTAVDVRVELRGLDETPMLSRLLIREPAPTLIPDSGISWPLFMAAEMARIFKVSMTWNEGDTRFTEVQHIST
jgi:hypothetical protein